MTSKRQQLTCLTRTALIVAALTTAAAPASAMPSGNGNGNGNDPKVTRTVTDDQNAPFADNNPCIGGALVAGTGHLHTVFIDRSKGTTVDTTYRFQHNGEATNVTDPNDPKDYRFKAAGDLDIKSSTRNFTYQQTMREHIIREGNHQRKDDYFVRSCFKITGLAPKPVITREHSESTCK
jgi:hypothetical protein